MTKLTDREVSILNLVGCGYTDKAIGEILYLSRSTIQNELQLIYIKLRVHNRTLAVMKALTKGLITINGKEVRLNGREIRT